MGKTERKRTLRIVGRKAAARERGSGRLRRDALDLLGPVVAADLPVWFESLITVLEERYTPRRPSVRDQVHFMVALIALVQPEPPANVPKTIDEALVYLGDPLGLMFAEKPELRFFSDSPNAGDPTCICSFCDNVIHEPPVLRIFDRERWKTMEARLHKDCFQAAAKYNLIPDV